jgi:hypothetical protein
VLLAMNLRRLLRVLSSMKAMSSSCVSVVGRLFMVSAFVMLGGFTVVAGGVGVML